MIASVAKSFEFRQAGFSVPVNEQPRARTARDYFVQQLNRDLASTTKRYGDGFEEQRLVNGWVMCIKDIAGLTPQQIASKFALPEVPMMMTDVTIPAGTRLDVSAANAISPNAIRTGTRTGDNGGGGGVQFQIKTEFPIPDDFSKLFTSPRLLPTMKGN